MKKLFDVSMLKFLLVGVGNTLLSTVLMFALEGLGYWPSTAANYLVGGIVSFFLNKYFTFQNKERSWWQVVKFIITVAVCWVIAYAIAKPLVLQVLAGQSVKIQENVAMLAGMCIYTGLNYFGQRFFAFKKGGKKD